MGANMKNWLEKLDELANQNRSSVLLVVVLVTAGLVAFLSWITGSELFDQLFDPKRQTVADVRYWSALVYALAFVMGLPVAFLLWRWRDRNVRDQIENTRKDLNSREFNEIQVRLAGAVDSDISEKSKIALQTAALFQMSEFLSGERGQQFSRAAFEVIRAKYATDHEEIFAKKFKREIREIDEIYDKIIHHRFKKYHRLFMLTAHFHHDLRKIRDSYENDPSKRMNRRFFRENFNNIFLNNDNARYFDISSLHIPADLQDKNLLAIQAIGSVFSGEKIDGIVFSGSNLLGATFRQTTISKCDFQFARVDMTRFLNTTLVDCNFSHAKFRRVQLYDHDPLTHQHRISKFVKCKFVGADLSWTRFGEQDLTDTDFSSARLICTDFSQCNVEGADFTNCDIRGSDMTRIDPRLLKSCEGARFDVSTQFHLPAPGTSLSWTQEQLVEIRELWRSCGAKHISES